MMEPYSLKIQMKYFFGVKAINIRNRYNCDELIVEAFKKANINLIEDGIKLTPKTLSESKYLRKKNKGFKIGGC